MLSRLKELIFYQEDRHREYRVKGAVQSRRRYHKAESGKWIDMVGEDGRALHVAIYN